METSASGYLQRSLQDQSQLPASPWKPYTFQEEQIRRRIAGQIAELT